MRLIIGDTLSYPRTRSRDPYIVVVVGGGKRITDPISRDAMLDVISRSFQLVGTDEIEVCPWKGVSRQAYHNELHNIREAIATLGPHLEVVGSPRTRTYATTSRGDKVLLKGCMDRRLNPRMERLLRRRQGEVIAIRWPGSAAKINSVDNSFFFYELDLLKEMGYRLTDLEVEQHLTCAAMGCADPIMETERHAIHIAAAKRNLEQNECVIPLTARLYDPKERTVQKLYPSVC